MVDKKFIDEALKAHNEYRSRHKVSALKHNKDISVIAQRWADHLASTGTFQHSNDRSYKGDKMGENIAMKWTSGGEDFTGIMVTNQWYSEVEKHNFSSNSGGGSGHFTQVVWKGSKEFGIGRAQGADGKWIVVGNYSPAGNMIGKYSENVFPPKDGKKTLIDAGKGGSSGAAAPASSSSFSRPTAHGGTFADSSSSTGGQTVSKETKTVTEGTGPNKVTKTIVTETVIGPDGSKRTTTKETVTSGGSDSSDIDRRFGAMGVRDDGARGGAGAIPKDKAQKPQKMKDFIEEVVKCHNKYRKVHGKVGDLKHNKDLDGLAQKWADHLAKAGVLSHSNATYQGSELGENVASKWSSAGADYTGQETVDQWYSENAKFDFRNGDFQQGTGHFTQVVWKDSREVGVGKAYSTDGNRVFVVCNYNPAGNVLGRFRENVFAKQ